MPVKLFSLRISPQSSTVNTNAKNSFGLSTAAAPFLRLPWHTSHLMDYSLPCMLPTVSDRDIILGFQICHTLPPPIFLDKSSALWSVTVISFLRSILWVDSFIFLKDFFDTCYFQVSNLLYLVSMTYARLTFTAIPLHCFLFGFTESMRLA